MSFIKIFGAGVFALIFSFGTSRMVRDLAKVQARKSVIAFWAVGAAAVAAGAILAALGGLEGIFEYFAARPEGWETPAQAGTFGLWLIVSLLTIGGCILFLAIWKDGMDIWHFAEWRRQVKEGQRRAAAERYQRTHPTVYTTWEF